MLWEIDFLKSQEEKGEKKNTSLSLWNEYDSMSVPTLTIKSWGGYIFKAAERRVKLPSYLNSRQWHWSEERHPVGKHNRPTLERNTNGIFLPRQDADTNEAGKVREHKFQCSQPLFFRPLVTVNNLGLRRFIALHSKRSRRIRVLWPSYWSNWEDVQQSKRHSWEPHRMHGIRKATGPLLAYDRLFKLFSGP